MGTTKSLDEYFYKDEYKAMMIAKRQANAGNPLLDLGTPQLIPSNWTSRLFAQKALQTGEAELVMTKDGVLQPKINYYVNKSRRGFVHISGITEPYFENLNEGNYILYTNKLKRRKFDYKREFMKDKKTGEILTEELSMPTGCCAIMTTVKIGVPNKYKPQTDEGFSYVDYAVDDDGITKFIYTIPKKYCYKCNQTALILTNSDIKALYGYKIPFTVGTEYKLLVVKYSSVFNNAILMTNNAEEKSYFDDRNVVTKMTQMTAREQFGMQSISGSREQIKIRVIHTKCDLNYQTLINQILLYWKGNGLIFDECINTLSSQESHSLTLRDMPYITLNNSIDFQPYDESQVLSAEDNLNTQQGVTNNESN